MKNNIEERYRSIIEDNGNVSKKSDLCEFFILIAGVVVLCVFVYFFADVIGGFFIDRMPDETQVKIESVLGSFSSKVPPENNPDTIRLNKIKDRITKLDKRLQKRNFNIYVEKSSEINAFIVPDGTIYVTSGLLKQDFATDEVLTFVLAHEFGHYVHRDILKSMSRTLIVGGIELLLTQGDSSHLSRVMGNVNSFSGIKYSQSAETEADLYANRIVKILYGRNTAAVKFFEQLDKKANVPEFLHYFSTHPSPKSRIKIIQKN